MVQLDLNSLPGLGSHHCSLRYLQMSTLGSYQGLDNSAMGSCPTCLLRLDIQSSVWPKSKIATVLQGRARMEWMTSKNFSHSKKFSKFLHQTCTAGLINPFLPHPPDPSFSITLQSCWKWMKTHKKLQLSSHPDPLKRECLCLETQCGLQGKCQVATHRSDFASYSLHFCPHSPHSSSNKEQRED